MSGPVNALDNADRILLGVCAAVWLAALGAGVAAIVALVDLGRGHPPGTESGDTPWLLYAVIAISLLVIVGAIPLLLRARAQAAESSSRPTQRQQQPGSWRSGGGYRSTQVVVSSYGEDSAAAAAVEQVWQRFTLTVTCAVGLATAMIGLATYSMATDHDVVAWCCYGVAGLVTIGLVGLPVLAWSQLDQLAE